VKLVPRVAGSYSGENRAVGLGMHLGPGTDSGMYAGCLLSQGVECGGLLLSGPTGCCCCRCVTAENFLRDMG